MPYTIKDHGVWKPYTPDPLPEWAASASSIGGAIVFIRRDSDRVDFYDYLKTKPFGKDAIVANTIASQGTKVETVGSVFRDPTMILPFNQRLIEILGVDPSETKPHNLLAWLIFDPDTLTFSGEPVPPQPPPVDMSVSAAQAKTALFNAKQPDGTALLDKVEQIVANHPYKPVRIFYQNANFWLRGNPYVRAIAIETGLLKIDRSGVEIDIGFAKIFEEAKKL